MADIWTVDFEANISESKEDFIKETTVHESFEKAKKEMLGKINSFCNEEVCFFDKDWVNTEVIEPMLNSYDYEDKVEMYTEDGYEDFINKTPEYLRRFFGGEAGNLHVIFEIDGRKEEYYSFQNNFDCNAEWGESIALCPFTVVDKQPDFGAEFPTLEINCFVMDDPDEDYYCYVRKIADYPGEIPDYFSISLKKTRVQ